MISINTKNPLRRFNNYLTTVIIGLSLYIIVTPFIPHMQLWWTSFNDSTNGFKYQSKLAESEGQGDASLASAPEENTLIIPSIQVDEVVIESDAPEAVDWGVWRRPQTSTPDKGGNTVLVAHRFAYSAGATFYHLDKMEVGEKFAVFWNDEEYIYEVFDIGVVPATAIEIEDNTAEPMMTLYTCTPIWTSVDRLVVKANLIDGPNFNNGLEDLERSSPEIGSLHSDAGEQS